MSAGATKRLVDGVASASLTIAATDVPLRDEDPHENYKGWAHGSSTSAILNRQEGSSSLTIDELSPTFLRSQEVSPATPA